MFTVEVNRGCQLCKDIKYSTKFVLSFLGLFTFTILSGGSLFSPASK